MTLEFFVVTLTVLIAFDIAKNKKYMIFNIYMFNVKAKKSENYLFY